MSQTAVIGRAAESFMIEGGRALHGRIRAAGNKNGALPILAACLLTSEPVVLRNVPRIADVETMLELLNDVGADADWASQNEVHVHAAGECRVMQLDLLERRCVLRDIEDDNPVEGVAGIDLLKESCCRRGR